MTGGVTVHANVWTGGDERPFLLVHGLASNARLWDALAERLDDLGHPVTAVDQRGHGLSDKPDDGYDFVTVTDDLARVIESLGWDRPVVVGQSWGGNVVLELAHRLPDLVAGIACVDGGTIQLADRIPVWEDAAARLSPPAITGTPFDQVDSMFHQMHPNWPESGIQGALACFEVRSDGTVAPWLTLERHLKILRALWEHRPADVYPEITVPVLLVPADSGDVSWTADKRAGIAAAEAALPISRTKWFTADHDIHAQYPIELADLIHACVEDGFFR